MLVTRNDTIDVPLAGDITSSEGNPGFSAVLYIREGSLYDRTILLRNKCGNAIDVVIQENDGSDWVDLEDLDFTLGAEGSGTEIAGGVITSHNILRILALGGGNSKDLEVGYCLMTADGDGLDDDIDTLRTPVAP